MAPPPSTPQPEPPRTPSATRIRAAINDIRLTFADHVFERANEAELDDFVETVMTEVQLSINALEIRGAALAVVQYACPFPAQITWKFAKLLTPHAEPAGIELKPTTRI